MDWFRPGAVILQCGADSLAGDKLGMFNLSMKGHADCVKFLNSFGVPLMLLGGGGYTTKVRLKSSPNPCVPTGLSSTPTVRRTLPEHGHTRRVSSSVRSSTRTCRTTTSAFSPRLGIACKAEGTDLARFHSAVSSTLGRASSSRS